MQLTESIEKSWIQVPLNSDFTLANFPYAVFQPVGQFPRLVTRLGDTLIDLLKLSELGLFKTIDNHSQVFKNQYLNDFISLGKSNWSLVRKELIQAFTYGSDFHQQQGQEIDGFTHQIESGQLLLPVQIGDYTDFYSSEDHARNVGIMFRDPANALLPNWKHLPVAYHGRSSSIVVSGTSIHRPKGQIKPSEEQPPVFGPTRQLDFELEMGFIVGKETRLGESVSTVNAPEHIFGMVIFNDLSARDIQKWEYVPLGPFLSKNFGSLVSPWVVTMEALQPFAVEGPVQEPAVLPYLQFTGKHNYDIKLEVYLKPEHQEATCVSISNYKHMYWNMVQQLAHHTMNGCNIRVGDLYASGTISGPTPGSYGSMLEIAWKGTKPVQLSDGSTRSFVLDYDSIIMKAWCGEGEQRVGFGEVSTVILPAIN